MLQVNFSGFEICLRVGHTETGSWVLATIQEIAEGVDLTLAMNFGPNLQESSSSQGIFLIDLPAMTNYTQERIARDHAACEASARSIDGVEEVLILSEHPWERPRDRPCMIVRSAASINHEELIGQLGDKLLSAVPDFGFQLRDDALHQHVLNDAYPTFVLIPADDKAFELRRQKGSMACTRKWERRSKIRAALEVVATRVGEIREWTNGRSCGAHPHSEALRARHHPPHRRPIER